MRTNTVVAFWGCLILANIWLETSDTWIAFIWITIGVLILILNIIIKD